MKEVTLDKDFKVFAASAVDAKVVYHEIFKMQAYNKHGIQIRDHDTVLDVGANIGLFSIDIAQKYAHLKLHLFEPVDDTFSYLSANATKHLGRHTYQLHRYGLSKSPQTVVFDYSPYLSMVSGMYSKELSKQNSRQASVYDWLIAAVEDIQRAAITSRSLTKAMLRVFRTPILRMLLLALIAVPVMLFAVYLTLTKKKVRCELKTLSDFFKMQNVDHVDLIKIDVEGAEMDVLEGVEDADWKKIKQLIIEVHDVEGRLTKLTRLLTNQGFKVEHDREDWSLHQLMNIYTVYAVRN